MKYPFGTGSSELYLANSQGNQISAVRTDTKQTSGVVWEREGSDVLVSSGGRQRQYQPHWVAVRSESDKKSAGVWQKV